MMQKSAYSQSDEMKKQAAQEMKEWGNSFGPEQFKHLGFADKTEFNESELGNPYVVYTISPDKLLDYEPGNDLRSLFTKAGYIIYPVISKGVNKSLLWMYQKDNVWKIARLGSSGISENIKTNEDLLQKYREEYKILPSEGPTFVRIYQLYLDFFFVRGDPEDFIVPMQTIPDSNIEGNTFYLVKELLPVLQELLKLKMPFIDEKGAIKEY